MGVVTDPGKVVKLLTSFSCCVGGVSIYVHVCVYLFSFGVSVTLPIPDGLVFRALGVAQCSYQSSGTRYLHHAQ